MVSICPKCHHEMNHEDYLFEVICSCGAHFNPFMTSQDSQSSRVAEAEVEKPQNLPPAEAPSDDKTSESEAAFAAIREYGEALSYNLKSASEPPVQGASGNAELGIVPSFGRSLGLCSAIVELADSKNPLGPAMQSLSRKALALGAKGLFDFRWQVLSDGRVLVSALAVSP